VLSAAAFGAAGTALGTLAPLLLVDRGAGARLGTICRGTSVWFHARDEAPGLRWSNLQRQPTSLASPLVDGVLPSWAEPPPPPYPTTDFLRIGTLAIGWPLPTLVLRWTVTDPKQLFPVAAQLDDQDTSVAYAASEWWIHWPGVLANLVIFSAAWAVPIELLLALARRRQAMLQIAAATASRAVQPDGSPRARNPP